MHVRRFHHDFSAPRCVTRLDKATRDDTAREAIWGAGESEGSLVSLVSMVFYF